MPWSSGMDWLGWTNRRRVGWRSGYHRQWFGKRRFREVSPLRYSAVMKGFSQRSGMDSIIPYGRQAARNTTRNMSAGIPRQLNGWRSLSRRSIQDLVHQHSPKLDPNGRRTLAPIAPARLPRRRGQRDDSLSYP
jgi:hypothetical protein